MEDCIVRKAGGLKIPAGEWHLHPDFAFESTRVMPEPGMVVVSGMMQPNRISPAIVISGCSGVTLEDVTIHHAGGMGLIAQRSENFTIRRMKVTLPAGKGRYVTTAADATNVHGCFVRVEKADGNTLTCQLDVKAGTPAAKPVMKNNHGIVMAE
jgi:hypothetical protein